MSDCTFCLEKVLKGYKPLLLINNQLILSRGNSLYISDLELSRVKFLCSLGIKHYKVRMFERIFRSGFGAATQLDEVTLLIQSKKKIYSVNSKKGLSHREVIIPGRRKLLSFCSVLNNTLQKRTIYFGEYFNNMNKREVNIWRRSSETDPVWQIVYTFDPGKINHIHGIFHDRHRDGFFLLAGDFGDAASIWFASNDFSIVKPLFFGSQTNRSCSIKEIDSNSFVYITDTQLENNRLMMLRLKNDKWTIESGPLVNGPCIYSASTSKYFIFSTSVEPGKSSRIPFFDIFFSKKSPVIFDKNAYLYILDENLNPSIVFKAEKDFMPYILGQFGTFTFPDGEPPPDRFFSYGVAVKKFDNSCLLFKSCPMSTQNFTTN